MLLAMGVAAALASGASAAGTAKASSPAKLASAAHTTVNPSTVRARATGHKIA